mgnify:CR=1 FL=1
MYVSHADDPSSGMPDGFDKFLVSEESESGELIARRQAAELGDAEAQYNLGSCFSRGYGVEQDTEQAVHWYRLAAEQGDAEVLAWLLVTAEQGSIEAQVNLVEMYSVMQ